MSLSKRFFRLFTIRTRLEACFVIYALALGGIERGRHYCAQYPGAAGVLLFMACMAAVMLAGGAVFDGIRHRRGQAAPTTDLSAVRPRRQPI